MLFGSLVLPSRSHNVPSRSRSDLPLLEVSNRRLHPTIQSIPTIETICGLSKGPTSSFLSNLSFYVTSNAADCRLHRQSASDTSGFSVITSTMAHRKLVSPLQYAVCSLQKRTFSIILHVYYVSDEHTTGYKLIKPFSMRRRRSIFLLFIVLAYFPKYSYTLQNEIFTM